jgi:hypothetical protein
MDDNIKLSIEIGSSRVKIAIIKNLPEDNLIFVLKSKDFMNDPVSFPTKIHNF